MWEDFDYDVASTKATCKRCGGTLEGDSRKGTSHLKRHLKTSICATRAAKRVAPSLPAAAPAGEDDDEELDEEALAKWIDDLLIDPELDAGLVLVDEQLDSGTSAGSPFTDGHEVDGGGEVVAAGDHDRRAPNSMPDTRMTQAPRSSSLRFFQKKRGRSAYLASHQGGTTDKDHSSRVNTD